MAISARRRGISMALREEIFGYVFILPWLVGLFVFTLGPMVASLVMSLTDYNSLKTPSFVGLANYAKIFTGDPSFIDALKVTVTYATVSVPLGMILSLGIALLMNQKVHGLSVWRTIYYLPSVVSGVSVALLWAWIFNPDFGLINLVLQEIGISGPLWLASPDWALSAMIIMSIWAVGGGMILNLAGLQGIPTDLYEAASIDGANSWRKFRSITLPMISPVLFFNLVMGIIGTFQYFTNAFVMTRGGPGRSTLFYNLYLYMNAFQYFKMGYASALAWILFLIVLLLTLAVIRSSPLWVYYEGQQRG